MQLGATGSSRPCFSIWLQLQMIVTWRARLWAKNEKTLSPTCVAWYYDLKIFVIVGVGGIKRRWHLRALLTGFFGRHAWYFDVDSLRAKVGIAPLITQAHVWGELSAQGNEWACSDQSSNVRAHSPRRLRPQVAHEPRLLIAQRRTELWFCCLLKCWFGLPCILLLIA